MSVYIASKDIAYFPMHKCANTSMKHAFFEIENGRPFSKLTVSGKSFGIHRLYQTIGFETFKAKVPSSAYKFAIVRDPIKRVISTYRDKVLTLNVLDRAHIKEDVAKAGLNPQPDLTEFLERLDEYRAVSRILREHTDSIDLYLGDDPDYYDELFDVSEMAKIETMLSDRFSKPVKVGQLNTTVKKPIKLRAVTEGETEALKVRFAKEYATYGSFYA